MIIIGHPLIASTPITSVASIQELKLTPPNSTVLIPYDNILLQYVQSNHVSYAVKSTSIKEAILLNAMGAKYIIATQEAAQELQKVAENYMFDSRILVIINDEVEIEKLAMQEIDGVIFQNTIK